MKLYFYSKNKKHTSKDTDVLIIKSACDYFNAPYKGTVIRDKNGKPGIEGCYVGVSHTDDEVLIALSEKNFGIDMERRTRRVQNKEKIGERFFSPREYDYIFCEKQGADERFIEIWVKKEAFVKYTGEGISCLESTDIFSLKGSFTEFTHKDKIIFAYESVDDTK
ncbi:MAG: 4'-phosphopantetheinyl transferase superfamily protein [Clostridia bacterium]|nr:4'-phosphopantetheinyl transferase superfamily protein [Clostridia bacterium]